MKWAAVVLALGCGCELADRAARRPGELKEAAVLKPSREELILSAFFTQDFAQKKIAHLASVGINDFDSVSQPRPRIADIVARFGAADATTEIDLSLYGVPDRAMVYRFGRLGLLVSLRRTDGEIFWTLIPAPSQ